MSQAAAPCPDLDHVDHRDRNRHARAFFETIRARNFEDTGRFRGLVLDQANLGCGTAHIETEHLFKSIARRDIRREHRATGRAAFDKTDREISSVLKRDDPAP